jgi:hypothetical protein
MQSLRMEKSRFRVSLLCCLFVVFVTLVFLFPSLSQRTPVLVASASSSGDIIALNNPCGFWWGCKTNNYDSMLLGYSSTWGLPDPMVIKAEIALESGFNPNAKAWNSYCRSYDEGLMQVNPTCNGLSASLLFQPSYNLYHALEIWGASYHSLQKKWGSGCGLRNLVIGTLEIYNLGPSGAGSWCGSFPKGTTYAHTVLYGYYYPFCKDSSYKPRI